MVNIRKKVLKRWLKCQNSMLTTNQNTINDFGRHSMVNKGHFNGLDKIYPEMLL